MAEELADIRLAMIFKSKKMSYKKYWFSYHLFLERDSSTLFGSSDEESDTDGGLQYSFYLLKYGIIF